MADTKITALAAIATVDPAADVLPIVDISDTSMAASGTTKKVTSNQILGAGGTATLASAAITGNLTVDTNTLFVNSTTDNVGIGTVSPVTLKSAKTLQVLGNCKLGNANDRGLLSLGDTVSTEANVGIWRGAAGAYGAGGNYLALGGYDGISFATGAGDISAQTERARIDSSGQLGIGVTPSAWGGAGVKVIDVGAAGSFAGSAADVGVVGNAYYNGSGWIYKTSFFSGRYAYALGTGQHQWFTAATGTAGNAITFTQAMTLDASGNLLVGTTSAVASGSTFQNLGTARQVLTLKGNDETSYTLGIWSAATTGDNFFAYFGTEASTTVRGSVTYNRAGGLVLYNTTSDYRAKDIIGSVLNSGSLIDSLKVYVGKMKGATIERPMLIAHEVQEIAPYAVNGEKDSVDADGKPKYQQMDASALVPLLIAEIQSLRTRVQTLEAR